MSLNCTLNNMHVTVFSLLLEMEHPSCTKFIENVLHTFPLYCYYGTISLSFSFYGHPKQYGGFFLEFSRIDTLIGSSEHEPSMMFKWLHLNLLNNQQMLIFKGSYELKYFNSHSYSYVKTNLFLLKSYVLKNMKLSFHPSFL